ncbi:DUF4253 domain-containing protein [Kitasatospora cheerisanensis]|uniref:DUF4253 domain-containing protein n=1 Tax=Kitasatospora cheerisanensis KCTC 2395 TaxID=1348663 RepID=A0A066YRT1_9ACTN|nr:DUF4253 domain-containing protein [Kitasatospora cheerisanensis]KDN80791.1 hypothetical protein KCH_74260 [Kitasatospora cheerisanensis KCTC 2395]
MNDAHHDLRRLRPDADLAALAALLPAGRLVTPDDNDPDAPPVLWMSDGPAPLGLWEKLHREHPASGLWPLLLAPLSTTDADFRPWGTGELSPRAGSAPDLYDPAALLRTGWEYSTTLVDADEDGEPLDPEEAAELAGSIAPFTEGWPGSAPAAVQLGDPDAAARSLARNLLANNAHLRIGLVPAATGAEALTACGWTGPVNHEDDVAKVSAVLLDWERRYGTRLVQVGFADLELSVSAPPEDEDTALRIAAEHLAFCPDNIFQGAGSLTEYAPGLVDADQWTFWWD